MYRVFIGHSSEQDREAKALCEWLIEQDSRLVGEIFLDRDAIRPGDYWPDELRHAMQSCETVIFLLSKEWHASIECQAEFRAAQYAEKRILCARLGPGDTPAEGRDRTASLQYVDLFGDDTTPIRVDSDHGSVEFSYRGLEKLRVEVIEKRALAMKFDWSQENGALRSPYPGGVPLEQEDAAIYFGRDAEILEATVRLRAMRISPVSEGALFVIMASSGAGKSSFLRAGLMPHLRALPDFIVLNKPVRPGTRVLTGESGLVDAIYDTCASAPPFPSQAPSLSIDRVTRKDVRDWCLSDTNKIAELIQRIRNAAARNLPPSSGDRELPTLVIPVDQAEELFTTGDADESTRFLELVGELVSVINGNNAGLIVIVTIRTELHQKLHDALPSVIDSAFGHLDPMPKDRFRDVIREPGLRARPPVRFNPRLVNQLVEDATGGDTLPLLALALGALFRESDGREIGMDQYGGISDVMQGQIEGILSKDAATRSQELSTLRTAFIPRLVVITADLSRVRRFASWAEFGPEAQDLLERFVEKRLLVRSVRDGKVVVEVALERMFTEWKDLGEWIEHETRLMLENKELEREATAWVNDGKKDDSRLLNGPRLDSAEELLTVSNYETAMTADTKEFIARSLEFASLSRVRRRVALSGLCMLAVIALIFGLIAWGNDVKKDEAEKRQRGLELVADAEQMLSGGRTGGDTLAMQLLLAGNYLEASSNAETLAARWRALTRVMENPRPSWDDQGVIPVHAIAIDPADGISVAAGSDDKLRVWQADSGNLKFDPVEIDGGRVLSVAYSPHDPGSAGGLIATGGDSGELQLWDAQTGAAQGPTMNHDAAVLSIAFSPDGKLIATGTSDGKLWVWDLKGRIIGTQQVAGPGGRLRAVAFKPTPRLVGERDQGPSAEKLLVTGDDDGNVQLWDAESVSAIGPRKEFRNGGNPASVMSVAFGVGYDETGEIPRIAVGLMDGTIQVLDDNLLEISPRVLAHPGIVSSVAFSPGGSRIVTGGSDNAVKVWDISGTKPGVDGNDCGPCLQQVGDPQIGHHGMVSAVSFASDGRRIVSAGLDGSVRVWDPVVALPILAAQGAEVRAVAFNPRVEDEMASGGSDGTVKLWNPRDGAPFARLGEPSRDFQGTINALAYSPDGDRLATGSFDGRLTLWQLVSPEDKPRADFEVDSVSTGARIMSVAFTSDGRIVTGDAAGWIRIWDGESDKLIKLAEAKTEYQVWSVASDSDGQNIATGSGFGEDRRENNLMQLWAIVPRNDADRMADSCAPSLSLCLQKAGVPVRGPSGWNVYAVRFSPRGDFIASATNDGTVRLRSTGAAGLSAGTVLSGDQNTVGSLAFAAAHHWLVSGSGDGTVRFWDTDKFEPIGIPIEAHRSFVYSVAVDADDRWIASAGGDGTIHLWPAPGKLSQSICSKINANMSPRQWETSVSTSIPYQSLCPDLPFSGST